MAKARKRGMKINSLRQRYLNDAEKKYSIGELEKLAVVWRWERFRFHIQETSPNILGPPSNKTPSKTEQNEQTKQCTANTMARQNKSIRHLFKTNRW